MTITYVEFDTTPMTFVADMKAKILSNPHWTDQGVVPIQTTTTSATAVNGATVNVTSVAGLAIGMWIEVTGVVSGSSVSQSRQISSISGSQVGVDGGWNYAFPSGSAFKTRNEVVRSTTERGAKLIVDLAAGRTMDTAVPGIQGVTAYRDYIGTTPSGYVDPRYYSVYSRASGGARDMVIHVVLSVGKNHLFYTVEGPRAYEANTYNTTYGSVKNYFSICDLIPYFVSDVVPAAVVAACHTLNPVVSSGHFYAHTSRDSADTLSWNATRLASLDWPTMFTSDVVTMPRNSNIDGNAYLFPYVAFSETEGLRGRLSSFYYCGTTATSVIHDVGEPVGAKVTYDGIVYKLIAVNKGDSNSQSWGPFGAINQGSAVMRSVVVAVPFELAAV